MRPPRSYAAVGTWPDLVEGPAVALYSAAIAKSLQSIIGERGLSLRTTAALTGVDRQTIARTLAGDTVPDLGTLAALEVGLGRTLWPSSPLTSET
jgi:transcriptional regulator with XRE-family HTH domain